MADPLSPRERREQGKWLAQEREGCGFPVPQSVSGWRGYERLLDEGAWLLSKGQRKPLEHFNQKRYAQTCLISFFLW